jgi:hypothetical protein
MMAHSLSESVLFLFRFLLLNYLLKEGKAETVNVGGTRLGHAVGVSLLGGEEEKRGGERGREGGEKREGGGEKNEGKRR